MSACQLTDTNSPTAMDLAAASVAMPFDHHPNSGGRLLSHGRTRPFVGDVRAQNRDVADGATLGAADPIKARYTLRAVITRGSRAITTARSHPVSTTNTAASSSGISAANTGIGR